MAKRHDLDDTPRVSTRRVLGGREVKYLLCNDTGTHLLVLCESITVIVYGIIVSTEPTTR